MRKDLSAYLAFFTGLFSGLFFIALKFTGDGLSHFPGDLADARFNNYLLEHAHLFFTGQTGSYWNAPFMFPEKNLITYSDNLLGTAPFYSLFRLVGMDRETAFQWWYILLVILNYTACYLFLKYLFKNAYAAVLGAMVFSFSIALQSQMTHAQTFARFAIPLALWMGCLYLEELRPKYFFLALLCVVYEIYCGIYLGFMLVVPVALFFIFSVFYRWRLYRTRIVVGRWWAFMAGALFLSVAALLPIMVPYLGRAEQVGLFTYEEILQTLPTMRSFFYSHEGSLFWEFLRKTGEKYTAFWDHKIFPGGVATLGLVGLAGVISIKKVRKSFFPGLAIRTEVTVLFMAGLATFLLFIRFQGESLYRIVHALPGFGSMRALQRIINVELLFYAIGVAFVFHLVLRKNTTVTFFIFLAAAALTICDNFLKKDTMEYMGKEVSQQRIRVVLEKMKNLAPGTIVSYEPDTLETDVIYYQLDAMLAAQTLGLRTLNGYTSNSPVGYSKYWVRPGEASRKEWLMLRHFPEDSVMVVH